MQESVVVAVASVDHEPDPDSGGVVIVMDRVEHRRIVVLESLLEGELDLALSRGRELAES